MKITPWPLLPGLVMGLCLFAASARADTIYTYTGNPFTVFSGLDVCPPVCNISGSFTLASPLAANLPFEAITPTAFSFTDGSVTVTEGASEGGRFEVATDSGGNISFWEIALGSGQPLAPVSVLHWIPFVTPSARPRTIRLMWYVVRMRQLVPR
jgi:hypothetical protein